MAPHKRPSKSFQARGFEATGRKSTGCRRAPLGRTWPNNWVNKEQYDSGLNGAAVYVLQTLGSLYLLIVLLRFILQLVRANFYNPLCQFIVKATQTAAQAAAPGDPEPFRPGHVVAGAGDSGANGGVRPDVLT
jgi:hypothetical protein